MAEQAIAAAKAEADGVERSAVDVAEQATVAATRKLDEALREAVGAPQTALIRDLGTGG